jgi:glyceraldehyde 3-phosphate dehydrogenase
MLTDMGVGWVIIGHSERREKGESDGEVAAKAKYALDKGLSVIACCGEPKENREAGTTNDFVRKTGRRWSLLTNPSGRLELVSAYYCFIINFHLLPLLHLSGHFAELRGSHAKRIISPYLLVLSHNCFSFTKTGLTATPEEAQDTHADIRQYLGEIAGSEIAESTRILYGGSASGKTAPDLSQKADIDGFLVGGASLKPEFADIINCQGSTRSMKPVNIGKLYFLVIF